MRILQIIQKKQLRGAEVFACQLSNNLKALGHDVKVVALLDGDALLPFYDEVEVVGINLKSRFFDYNGWKALAKIIKEYKPDIVQANAGDTLKYASFSKKIFGWNAKLVFRNANKMGDFIDATWKKQFNKWLLKEVDYVASVSEECKLDFIDVFTWPAENISTLPIGVEAANLAIHNPLHERQWESRYPVLLSVAGFVPEKNHAALVDIFCEIKSQYQNAALVLIGEGKLQQQILEKCKVIGIADDVWFAGKRNDVAAFMQHCSALLMPSLIEGLPGVILEAFANDLPVVAYNVGGIPEVIIDGKTGYLVAKNNEPEFVIKVNTLLSLPKDQLFAIKQNARALTLTTYNNHTIASKFEDAYKSLIAPSKLLYP